MTQQGRSRNSSYEHVKLTAETRATLTSAGAPTWTIEARPGALRELIVHEDKLTTERIQALYTLQGFLFATFCLLTRADFPLPIPLRIMTSIIAVVGITSARIYWQELLFNTAAITQLLHEWDELRGLFPDVNYPSIIGFVAKPEILGGPKWLPRRTVPTLFMVVWLVAAAVAWLR